MYMVFGAPLQMLADSPNAHSKEPESTDFITQVPTLRPNRDPGVARWAIT